MRGKVSLSSPGIGQSLAARVMRWGGLGRTFSPFSPGVPGGPGGPMMAVGCPRPLPAVGTTVEIPRCPGGPLGPTSPCKQSVTLHPKSRHTHIFHSKSQLFYPVDTARQLSRCGQEQRKERERRRDRGSASAGGSHGSRWAGFAGAGGSLRAGVAGSAVDAGEPLQSLRSGGTAQSGRPGLAGRAGGTGKGLGVGGGGMDDATLRPRGSGYPGRPHTAVVAGQTLVEEWLTKAPRH